MTGLKWSRKTTRKIADQLKTLGITISRNTVGRLLKQMNFSLRVNQKKLSEGSSADRDQQFAYIMELRRRFVKKGDPVVSVDTKKKEMVGSFKNPGTTWTDRPILVNDHDFRSMAKGIAIPYGVYDVQANRGTVFVGTSHDTPQFAVECLEKWWRLEGRKRYPQSNRLCILADSGGSNGPTSRAWKTGIQEQLCDRHGLSVSVSHYPSGTSKWNPIEHRLFSEISKNWAGRPLDSYETILRYLRTTSTTTGLHVNARLIRKKYPRGVKVSNRQMENLSVTKHESLPKWNYTLIPTKNGK